LFVVLFLHRPPISAMLPLVYLGGLTAVLLAIGEVQPRYLLPIWLFLRGAIACAAAQLRHAGLGAEWRRLPARVVVGPVVLAVPLAVAWLALSISYGPADGRILTEWDAITSSTGIADSVLARDFEQQQLGTKVAAGDLAFGSLVTTLKLPRRPQAGDTIELSRELCARESGRLALALHLYTPEKSATYAQAFEFAVLGNDRTLHLTQLDAGELVLPIRVDDLFGERDCTRLGLRLTALRSTGPAGRAVSTIHLYFPRLVEPDLPVLAVVE
jgi:hypothetical protein